MTPAPSKKARVTIYDVAEEAGVSKSLVSLVLQGNDKVSDARRELVMQAIEKLGYKPSRAAKALAGKSSKTIGVLVEDYANLWFVRMIQGLREVFDKEGYQITISDLHLDNKNFDDPISAFLSMHVDGIVLAVEPSEIGRKLIPIPVVIVGDRESSDMLAKADVVTNDDYSGARGIVKHLIDQGHTIIAHIAAYSGPAKKRLAGYQDEMKSKKLKPLVDGLESIPSAEAAYKSMNELLRIEPGLTAVFAANDTMAAGAIAALRASGKSVPKDISVVGFDNSLASSQFMFNFSTVDYAGEEIGREAAQLMLERIAHPNKKPRKLMLPSELIIRDSTRVLRK